MTSRFPRCAGKRAQTRSRMETGFSKSSKHTRKDLGKSGLRHILGSISTSGFDYDNISRVIPS